MQLIFFDVERMRALPCRKHPGVNGAQNGPGAGAPVGTIAPVVNGGGSADVPKLAVPPSSRPQDATGTGGLISAPEASKYSIATSTGTPGFSTTVHVIAVSTFGPLQGGGSPPSPETSRIARVTRSAAPLGHGFAGAGSVRVAQDGTLPSATSRDTPQST
jgi:hypothetical protein